MDNGTVGPALGAERQRQGLSRYKLAKSLDMDESTLRRIESGVEPALSRAHRIAEALGVYLRIGSQTSRKKLNIPAPKGKA